MENIRLFYNKIGENTENTPLLVLHGLFGMGDNWASIARHLGTHRTVIMPDQRNHGRSPKTDAFSYEILVNDLYHFIINDLKLSKIILLGHSMGGKVAMIFAQTYPDIIEKLIVVDMPLRHVPVQEQLKYLKILSQIDLNAPTRTQIETQLAEHIVDMGIRQFLMKNLFRNADDLFEWRINVPVFLEVLPGLQAEVNADIAFEKPTLFVRGAASNYILPADYAGIARVFSQASIATIQGAGHWVHVDKPHELLLQIQAFLV
jgi:pimeloyl-ACP methyl ester carboxylesterase